MVILGHNLNNSQVSVYRTIGPTLVIIIIIIGFLLVPTAYILWVSDSKVPALIKLLFSAASRENLLLRYPTMSDTNRAVQPQKMARGFKFWIRKDEGFYYIAKTKALISCTVICALVLA